jgi:hypothetical protein
MEARAARPLVRSRAVRKRRAPVEARARAVSMPMPELQPVIRMVLSVRFPRGVSAVNENRDGKLMRLRGCCPG